MAERKDEKTLPTRKLLNSAIEGGIIDAKMPMAELVDKLGPSIDEVAGYVLAWDKYVLVVGAELPEDVIVTRRR
ncbi:MAG: hypothetical protein AB2809_07410 [Candidatus Thiodiazotropha sp.]